MLQLFPNFVADEGDTRRRSPEPDCPIVFVSWYQAAEYCNRLSQAEQIPEDQWCYLPADGQYAPGMRLAPDYLLRTGYRLPTEAEWEYACRAGAVISRYYGQAEELLGEYGWHLGNSQDRTWPGGRKKPNDFGLFDMHGNVYNWCNDQSRDYPPGTTGDREHSLLLDDNQGRVLRGGSFSSNASLLRCAHRARAGPYSRNYLGGFRLARTCP